MGLFGSNNVVKDRAEEVKDKAEGLKDKVEAHLPSFSSSTPVSNKSKLGSGAEVDRYGSYFGAFSLGADAKARFRAASTRAANHQGEGSEQGIYGSHLSLGQDEIGKLLKKVQRKADKEIFTSGAWLGYDGRVLKLAAQKGVGAEQDRFGKHFGLDEDTVKQLTDRLAAGAEKVKKSVGA